MYFLNDTYKIKIIFLSLLFSCLHGNSALLPDSLLKTSAIIRSFEPDRIINSSPNYSIIFGESGIMFLGQEDKISIYNGFSWSNVHVKGEILLTRNSNNTIFFSGDSIFGIFSADSSQKFRPQFLHQHLPEKIKPFRKAEYIKSIDKTFYIKADSVLFSYNLNEFQVLDTNFSGGKIFTCRQNLLTLNAGNIIKVYNGSTLENTYFFKGQDIKMILEHAEGYLIVTRENKCIITNSSFKILSEWPDSEIKDPQKGLLLNSDEYIFSDINNALFLFDKNGNTILHLYNDFQIPDSDILEISQENSGNIWILQEKSLFRIEYPSSIGRISHFPATNGNILDTKIYDGKIFVAATGGLFYLDSSTNQFVKTLVTEYCFRLIPAFHGLMAFSNDKIFLLHKDLCSILYTGKMLDQSWNAITHKLYISESDNIRILSLEGNKITDTFSLIPPVTPLRILSNNDGLWISDGLSLYRYKNPDDPGNNPEKIVTPDSMQILEMFSWQNKLHLLTIGKIYSFTENHLEFERSLTNDLCRGEFISTNEDSRGNIWILTENHQNNKTVWFGDQFKKSFSKISLPPWLCLSNPSIDYPGDQKIILSSPTQIFLLDMQLYSSQIREFETIIRKISCGDQTLFDGVSYNFFRVPLRAQLNNIPFNCNNIRIELSSTNYLDSKVSYQYFLKETDKIWSEWTNDKYIVLKNLKEGQYNLKIRCKDYMDQTSEVTSLTFRINPPFYRSWWAYILYTIIAGIILFIGYKTYLLNLHKARVIIPSNEEGFAVSGIIPVVSSTEIPAQNKGFNFYSNIDEEKVKEKTRWDKYDMVTVLFSDIQGFTKIAESMNPELLIDELDRFFFHFDSVVEKYNIEKIKTIGDAYMAAGGIPRKSVANPIEVVLAALEMQNYMKQLKKTKIDIWDLRIGIHSGPVIAGIIGHKKRSFDIWGDTVNTASRMESTGEAGKVNISSETYRLVKDYFICDYRGKLPVKYKGNIDMYFVKGLRPELSVNLIGLPNRKFFLKLQTLRLADLEEIVFQKLETELHKNLIFHTAEYSRHLYEYSGLLAKASDLDQEESLFVRTSALLLNVGFTRVYDNQENKSAEFAREILPEFNYSEKQKNMLEMVLYDIKMEFIGRADFIRLYKLLFLEQNQYQKSLDIKEFKRKQLLIIQDYQFYTESAKRLREIPPEEQLVRIKDDDWK